MDVRFETADGQPVPAVTAEEMREVDRIAVETVGIDLLQMMENAGRNLAEAARDLADGPVVVVAGSGGNGGGGLCCARHLANHGREVAVVLDRDPDELDGAAAAQFGILDAMGVTVDGVDALSGRFVVDALVGYGLTGALRGRAAALAGAIGERADRVLSLDVPSGVHATTGETPGVAVTPDWTLTLALPKTGLAGTPGELYLGDIAIPATVYERAGIGYGPPFDGRYRLPIATDG